MDEKLYIDDSIDVYAQFGVFVTQGSYGDLACFAPTKNVDSIDWHEEDGVEFDLSELMLDSRDVSIGFASHGENYDPGAFIQLLSDGAYHKFHFTSLDRIYRLRLVSQPDVAVAEKFGTMTLLFADDFPLKDYVYMTPESTLIPTQGYEINGVDFSKYGVRVLKGSLNEVEKSPTVKQNMLRNINSSSGVIYDGGIVTFETKDVRINCLMRANTVEEFWRNHDALLYDLKRQDRLLYVDIIGYEYPFFYKSCSVAEFLPQDMVWFEFAITLTFTSFRVGPEEYLLACEDAELVMTEKEDYMVDVKPYEGVCEQLFSSEVEEWIITENKQYIDTKSHA